MYKSYLSAGKRLKSPLYYSHFRMILPPVFGFVHDYPH